eukprot:SAG11_NODE_19242_length_471_cov_0.827957_1_plen_117_part_10
MRHGRGWAGWGGTGGREGSSERAVGWRGAGPELSDLVSGDPISPDPLVGPFTAAFVPHLRIGGTVSRVSQSVVPTSTADRQEGCACDTRASVWAAAARTLYCCAPLFFETLSWAVGT